MVPTFTCGPLGGHNRSTVSAAPLHFWAISPQPAMSSPVMALPDSDKTELRRRALALRANLNHKAEAAAAVAKSLEKIFMRAPHKIIAGYHTLGDEMDCGPALAVAAAAGHPTCLPVAAQGQALLFRSWRTADPLEKGPFGTSHPVPAAPVIAPDILLVPLLAFDNAGGRLGYGSGYYDRTLRALRSVRQVLAIGLAYDAQEAPSVPTDINDQPLDMVVTELRVLTFSPSPLLAA